MNINSKKKKNNEHISYGYNVLIEHLICIHISAYIKLIIRSAQGHVTCNRVLHSV